VKGSKDMTDQDVRTLPERAETVPTRFITAGDVRFAYRRFGKPSTHPLVLCQHFRGTMDNWDPALLNDFAQDRTLIIFDNAGVGLSTGSVPSTITEMAQYALAFIDALGLTQIDLLGFSMGGFVAQRITLGRPNLVHRLILAGTGPGKGEGIQVSGPNVIPRAINSDASEDMFLYLFFEQSETSQAAGHAYWARLQTREGERSPLVSGAGLQSQLTALIGWSSGKDGAYPHLEEIRQPVLMANGSNDIMVPTVNSFIMFQRLPNAQLILYPDSGHGFLFQYHDLFVEHVSRFLRD
jgi:pimeloyl-ACP methyl ester carboxylesterase